MRSPVRSVVIPLIVTLLAVAGLGVVHGFGANHLAAQSMRHVPRTSSHKHANCILESGLMPMPAKFRNQVGSTTMAQAHAPGDGIPQAQLLTTAEIELSRTTGFQTRSSSPVFTGVFRI